MMGFRFQDPLWLLLLIPLVIGRPVDASPPATVPRCSIPAWSC